MGKVLRTKGRMGQPKPTAAGGRKQVGTITPDERDEIKALFERKNGLTELFRSLLRVRREELEGSAIYERLVADMGETNIRFQDWFKEKSHQYSWESVDGYQWQIDFDSCAVFLEPAK